MGSWMKTGWRYGTIFLFVLLALSACTPAPAAAKPGAAPKKLELIEFYSPM